MQINSSSLRGLAAGLLIAALLVVGFNAYQIGSLSASAAGAAGAPATGLSTASPPAVRDESILPKGTPPIYGEELGVSFDDVSEGALQKADATIARLGTLDSRITLEGEALQRYIQVASQISCEYCCGTDSIIFQDGSPACGCAHSYAMRGLAKHLIQRHGSEYTDEQILEEMGKWKVLFFPTQHAEKAARLRAKGIEASYINLASNKYRGG